MSFFMRTVMWAALVGGVLSGGYWLAKPTSQAQPMQPSAQEAVVGAPLKQFSMQIVAGAGNLTPPVFRVTENDNVAIRVKSDEAGTLMLHGYTDGVAVKQNAEATVRFKASHTGRFPMHLHGEGERHVDVAIIEILPK